MRRTPIVAFAVTLLLAGCSAKRNAGSAAPADSARGVDSSAAATIPAAAPRLLSYEERQGSLLYAKYCAVCHGKEGKGDGFNAFNLDPRPRDFSDSSYMAALSDGQILQTIAGGGRSVNKSPLMPSYGWTMDAAEIRYVVSYIRTFSSNP